MPTHDIVEMVKLIFHQFETALTTHTHSVDKLSDAVEKVANVVSDDHKRCDTNHKKTHDFLWKGAVLATAYMLIGGIIVAAASAYLDSKGVSIP